MVDGSQQPTKGDLNKLYSAMQYEKQDMQTASPLRPTRSLVQPRISTASGATTSRTKNTWPSVQETHNYFKSAKEEHIEGWLSRYQVAAEEKLPPDSALLQELLDQLPSRAHRTASWAANGEKRIRLPGSRPNRSKRQH